MYLSETARSFMKYFVHITLQYSDVTSNKNIKICNIHVQGKNVHLVVLTAQLNIVSELIKQLLFYT